MTSKICKFSLFTLLFLSSTVFSQNCKLKVIVSGIEEVTGQISIGVFADPEGFPQKDSNSIGIKLEVTNKTMEYTFTKLKKGEYAIAVYHDENNNGELDKNFFGMPTEDYVFSNYATGNFGPPSFNDAKFTLVDSMMINLDLQGK